MGAFGKAQKSRHVLSALLRLKLAQMNKKALFATDLTAHKKSLKWTIFCENLFKE